MVSEPQYPVRRPMWSSGAACTAQHVTQWTAAAAPFAKDFLRWVGLSLASQWVTSASTHILVHPRACHVAGECRGSLESHERVTSHGSPDLKQSPMSFADMLARELRYCCESGKGAEPTCQLLFHGRMASSLSLGRPRTPLAAKRPMRKEPNMLDGRSGKYAPRLL